MTTAERQGKSYHAMHFLVRLIMGIYIDFCINTKGIFLVLSTYIYCLIDDPVFSKLTRDMNLRYQV